MPVDIHIVRGGFESRATDDSQAQAVCIVQQNRIRFSCSNALLWRGEGEEEEIRAVYRSENWITVGRFVRSPISERKKNPRKLYYSRGVQ